jgi:CRISPR system Cascade subunit CasE
MKSFLSQITMPYAEALNRKLTNSYLWHQWIWQSFPGKPDAERDFLFRVDIIRDTVRVLLLSEHIPQKNGDCTWQSKSIADGFLMHTAYRFQVRANPTFRRSKDRRRIPLYQQDKLQDWFQRKLAAIGCNMHSIEVGQPQNEEFIKDGKRIRLSSVDASGILEVIERESFIKGFSQGIGSAKGFGFGLLMLQPIQL